MSAVSSYIPVASTSGHALDSKQILKRLHNDLDSFSKISQVADVDITEHSDPVVKVSGPDFRDSNGNSDDSQASANVDGDCGGGGDNNED
jgi:hypothetical protein